MSSNVLPSAPDYSETETQTLYPVLPTQPDNNFRMQKANEVLKYLSDEVSHYRLVAKKYKRTKTIINYACFSTGGISGFLSAGGVAAAFTVTGIPAAIPIGCVASFFGLTAAGLTGLYKKLEPTLIKHCKIMTLALSKCDTVNHILSKSLIDGKISDAEFQSILDEKESYRFHFPRKNRNIAALTSKKYDKRPCMKNELGFKKKDSWQRGRRFEIKFQSKRTLFHFIKE